MHNPLARHPWINTAPAAIAAIVVSVSVSISGCTQVNTNASEATADYEATATTTYTWQVEYLPRGGGPDRPNDRRLEQFQSTTVVNRNGIRPDAAGSGPDDKGLWWPVLPPEPTVDDIEERLQQGENPRPPEVIKSVDYAITFNQAGDTKTLPTDYDVYRQAVKAFEKDRPLALTLGPQDKSVLKADIQ
ncbi:MAG: hypothetical protein WA885_14935 [Phormidesmis sp.]